MEQKGGMEEKLLFHSSSSATQDLTITQVDHNIPKVFGEFPPHGKCNTEEWKLVA